METIRILLFLVLAVVLVLIWEAWQRDYGTPTTPAPETVSLAESPTSPEDIPAARGAEAVPTDAPAALATPAQAPPAELSSRTIRVGTDVLGVNINTRGGDINRVELLDYPVEVGKPGNPLALLNNAQPNLFITQSGLLSQQPAPTHHAEYSSKRDSYLLDEGSDELEVRLQWKDAGGLTVNKVFVFRRGAYLIDVFYEVVNGTTEDWTGRMYRQFQRTEPEGKSRFIYTYTGGVISSEEKRYEKIDFSDMEDSPLNRDIRGGWAAMIQHYFLAAWLPAPDELNRYYTKVLDGTRYVLGLLTAEHTVPAGQTARISTRLYAGPKLQERLEAIAPGLELTADYGWLTFLAKPLFWLLGLVHKWLGNWGWAIIIVTLLIKLAFYKLSETSYRSMANMKRLAPRLQALKERCGDDRQALNKAMMDLYKREKINPLGGCFPILIQIPVFIAFYWVLLESVEFRQAPFIFWWNDLSSPDPYFVLPILMGVTMVLQQRLNPAPMDPVQQKVMMALPVVFTVFFLFFPSGLVLYWVVNNILSIAQQWVITRRIVPDKH